MSYYNKKNITDINVTGKKVIVRVDFNVPFDSEGCGSTPDNKISD